MRGKSLHSSHATLSKACRCKRMCVYVWLEEEWIVYEEEGERIEVVIKLQEQEVEENKGIWIH